MCSLAPVCVCCVPRLLYISSVMHNRIPVQCSLLHTCILLCLQRPHILRSFWWLPSVWLTISYFYPDADSPTPWWRHREASWTTSSTPPPPESACARTSSFCAPRTSPGPGESTATFPSKRNVRKVSCSSVAFFRTCGGSSNSAL